MKRENRTMNTQNILCQQAVNSILKEPFSLCLQSFRSICQTLPFHRLANFGYNGFYSSNALDQISILLDRPFGFSIQEPPFVVKSPFLGFQLDLFSFFIFYFILLWFKLPFRVFTLNLFFSFLAKTILSGFQF